MEEQFDLSGYMKQYRRERHISLRAASPNAASTLSRFENGKTQISGDRLRAVMQREGLRYWDLQQHSMEFLSPFKQIIDNLYIERFDFSSDRVPAVLRLYRNRTAGNKSNLAAVINSVLDALQAGIERSAEVRLSESNQRAIQELLFSARDWIISDYGLLWLAAPYLETTILKRLLRRAIVQDSEAPSVYTDYFERALNRVSLVLLCRHDIEIASLVRPVLEPDKVNAFVGEDALTYNFLQIMLSDGNPSEKQTRFREFESELQVFQLTKMNRYFSMLAATILEISVGDGDHENHA